MNRKQRVLVVDDDNAVRDLLAMTIQFFGYETETARDGFEALAKIHLDIDLILLDVQMPGMDGFEVARRIRSDPTVSDLPICMITGNTDRSDRLRAVEVGVNDFVGKPADETELRIRTASLLKQKEAQDQIKRYQEDLEQKVNHRTQALRKALEEIADAQRKTNEAHLDTIRRLAIAAEYRDDDTANHIQRVSLISGLLAEKLHFPAGEVEIIREAVPMHDVGKIGIPDEILFKPGKLTDEEFDIMKRHTIIGGQILEGSPSEFLKAGEVIALSHHEKWDGSGYPKGLSGEDIPLWGRICAVTDVFDALLSSRPYKPAFPMEKVMGIMKEGRGKHFDPALLDIFIDNLDATIRIRNQYS